MENYTSISFPKGMLTELDRRRGLIKRSTYVQNLVLTAWRQGLEVSGAGTLEVEGVTDAKA